MKQYPVHLNLENKQVVIVGGGKVAERKLLNLSGTGAEITVISPEVTGKIQDKVEAGKGKLHWKQKLFSHEDIGGAFLVIAATNDKQTNSAVYAACNDQQLISLVDDPEKSNFILPATVHRGKLVITVSTSGASPGLSKKIISDISSQFDDTYEDYVEFLSQCRLRVLGEIENAEKRKQIFGQLLEPVFLDLTRKRDIEEREKLFEGLLKSER